MPIFKAGDRLVYYAHIPKCGGTAVAWYLSERFGKIAFSDSMHTRHDPVTSWSKSSPQHIDNRSLSRLFPRDFFDATFTIVRHPVARLVSAYHFQLEVESSISGNIGGFSDWLAELPDMMAENPFIYDNHVRPMNDLVPNDARIFHMEHGLDGLVAWFDELTGEEAAPRAVPRFNERGGYVKVKTEQVLPSDLDLERISRLYAADFERFGYQVDQKFPQTAAPQLSARQIRERDTALKAHNDPLRQVSRKIRSKLGL
ncbi:sulfotransferase family 2 domain-containing protein [Qingshengfaniella alkalisoli]|uniref:Sulfotransferase family protein n=1 Tax=Qingshengfaniella alkalisoli TaxID=2599296 RepID=A0A5B8J2G7_9RHOB|nr:sulfotransferase family 2 domain-containing protein [Qingshengfaniella alkalisoli]QDY70968.1 sulfotransferase family protein [Qingshengfaniella alkalisoli]